MISFNLRTFFQIDSTDLTRKNRSLRVNKSAGIIEQKMIRSKVTEQRRKERRKKERKSKGGTAVSPIF